MITKAERKAIKSHSGLKYAKIIRVRQDRYGYPDRLIEAQDDSGFKFRGWLCEGEAPIDVRWETENTNGWSASAE